MGDTNERLKTIRKELGISQKDMASSLGFKQSYYSDVENGKRNVTGKVIESLQKKFNVSSDWILTGNGNHFLTISEKIIPSKNVPPAYYTAEISKGIDFIRRFHSELEKENKSLHELLVNISIITRFQLFIKQFEKEYLKDFDKKSIPFDTLDNYKEYKAQFISKLSEYEHLKPILKKLSKAILQFYADFKPFDKENIIENHFDTSNS